MKLFYLFLIVGSASSYINEDRPNEGAEWSDLRLDTVSLIRKYKYPAELHRVTTEDGYILTIHRIPHGRLCPKEQVKGPILVQHGILSASTHWILPGTKNSLGYILADSCYDVWMPNSRGNSFSLGHVKYTTQDKAYWDFSFHEMGVYDLPAIIDYILNVTATEDLTYVGHSQGTTAFLVFNILRPEYVRKVRASFLLAPIAYIGNSRSPVVRALGPVYGVVQTVANLAGIYNVAQQKDLLSNVTTTLCTFIRPITPILCGNLLFTVTGFDNKQTNLTFFSILTKNEIYGASVKQLAHYAQMYLSGKFHQYDYGIQNTAIYGQSTPPEYDLSKAKAPIHIYYSSNDFLADLPDVTKLRNELTNLVSSYLVPFKNFNHLDHLFAMDVVKLEYNNLVEEIDSYY